MPRKTFKEYYADPEFRERHLRYIKEKLPCTCGKLVSRANMHKHKLTNIHQRRLELLADDDLELIKSFYEDYSDIIATIDLRLQIN